MEFFIRKETSITAKGKYKDDEFDIPDEVIGRDVEINETLDLWQHGKAEEKNSTLCITSMPGGSFSIAKAGKRWQLKPIDDVPGSTTVNVEIGDIRPGDESKTKNKKK